MPGFVGLSPCQPSVGNFCGAGKVGSCDMSAKQIVLSLAAAFLALSFPVSPAQAADTGVINYCASKSTAKVRAIESGKCASNEWSLGPSKIDRGKKRPDALVPKMSARYKAAKVLGFCLMNSSLTQNAQQGWPSQISLERMWIKPTSSYTARWLNGSGPKNPSILPARKLATISGGGVTRICTSVSGLMPFSAK